MKTNIVWIWFLSCCYALLVPVAEAQDIEITLIFPELTLNLAEQQSPLEGLVSDLSVKQIRLVVNDQPVRFVQAQKGYFKDTVRLNRRENTIELSGATPDRNYFSQTFTVINTALEERSPEEKVPPMIEVHGLSESELNILSPVQASRLKVKVWDNRGLAQASWFLKGMQPRYFEPNEGAAQIQLPRIGASSTRLSVRALDKDGNSTLKTFHLRVEDLSCDVTMTPDVGVFESTPAVITASIRGGVPPLERRFRLIDKASNIYATQLSDQNSIVMRPQKSKLEARLQAELLVTDKNGIDARCVSEPAEWYSQGHPPVFKLNKIKLDSISQKFEFQILPPVRSGQITVMLKRIDPMRGVSGQEWKVLGESSLDSAVLRSRFQKQIQKRVPAGEYYMKLGYALRGDTQMRFTDARRTEVSQSQLDERNLLQDILREELK